ncbi:unnamed protein product [Cylicocyclus nassatus]|uniref:G-protein coupled receptors family 1 profile domain-containing protein n=1 Tax=Cylicocyclus nassatus TaxID=53992 RepID=A0AA36M8W4_CYLNA|nr:unnamed protein product [Cylicocyclus nassatus]
MISQQSILTLAISVDLLAALLFPLWYRICRTAPYVTAIFALCSLYSLSALIWGSATQDDEVILFCNPPLALSRSPSRYWSISGVFINCLVLLVYTIIILYVKFRAKSRICRDNRRVIRRLRVLVIIFVLSWFMCSLGIDMGHVFNFRTEVFFALLCYSQTFYICIWRSAEYRAAFKEQLLIMICKMGQIHQEPSHSKSQGAVFLHAPANEKYNDK